MFRTHLLVVICAVGLATGSGAAQSITVSLAIRETGVMGPLGSDGGVTGGIEWVNLDVNVVALDGLWQQVSFDLQNATLSPFAGATADGMYSTQWGTIEHIRFRNTDGLADPLQIFLDDLRITDRAGASVLIGWEEQALGSEHVFQEPSLSGSTFSNILPGSSAAVSDAMAHSGAQAYELNWQFVDADPTRWLRLTTFNADSGANPTIDFNGTVSFWIKGGVIPAPSGALLAAMGALTATRRRRR